MSYWLLKTEPSTFGLEHLEKMPKRITPWDGVRNFQARNFIRDMRKGDLAFFYHSSCKVPGIVAIVEVVKNPYPDDTAFDPQSPYYDEKSTLENPRWYRVDVQLVSKFKDIISLTSLRNDKSLRDMLLLKQGSRLSVTPVTSAQWHTICDMG
jgi:predicted RNA-binding protein with PUA-like domain